MTTLKLDNLVRNFLASYGFQVKSRRVEDNSLNLVECVLFWAMICFSDSTEFSFPSLIVYSVTALFCAVCIFYTFKLLFLAVSLNASNEKRLAAEAYVFWFIQYLKQFNGRYAYALPVLTFVLLLLNGYLLPVALFGCSLGLMLSIQKSCFNSAEAVQRLAHT